MRAGSALPTWTSLWGAQADGAWSSRRNPLPHLRRSNRGHLARPSRPSAERVPLAPYTCLAPPGTRATASRRPVSTLLPLKSPRPKRVGGSPSPINDSSFCPPCGPAAPPFSSPMVSEWPTRPRHGPAELRPEPGTPAGASPLLRGLPLPTW